MKHLRSHQVLSTVAGIDWATDTNELCIIDHQGNIVERVNRPADAAGIARLVQACQRHDTARVAIERPDGPVVDALLAYVATLTTVVAQIRQLDADITQQLADHPDAHIFTSLPRAGRIRAAKLLAEIGDARGRFPTEASLAALAGACPSTRQSGRLHVVTFRWACNKKLRAAVMDFAADSRQASPWAADIYNRHRAAGKTHQHAVRILARAWLRVIWRCWQDRTAYDPALHGGAKARLTTAA